MTKYNVPFDLFGFRILEWRKSIPALFLLLALLSLFSKPSVYNVITIIALLSWADIARLIRAETLTIKNHLFVQSAITMGFSHVYIIVHHIFPMLKGSLIVIAMYIMAGAVLMEATLSFLGLGLPVEEVSWGKLLAESRNARAWWMAVFPGGCLIMLLLFLHSKTKRFQVYIDDYVRVDLNFSFYDVIESFLSILNSQNLPHLDFCKYVI
ncbi:MAG: ABC transporter permease [Saprospiraceae bacterium]|nr:ABC transporter permease [Saprospiraceae bacterium]